MSLWGNFLEPAKRLVDIGDLDASENQYKLDQGRNLASARNAFLAGEAEWVDKLESGLVSNLLHYIQRGRLLDWVKDDPAQAESALRAIWTTESIDVVERIRGFCSDLPGEVLSGVGARTNLASVLLMALGAETYPPYRVTIFGKAYAQFGFESPSRDFDESEHYAHALSFLDALCDEAKGFRLEVRHRLDAQSIIWLLFAKNETVNLASTRKIWLMALGRDSVHWDSCQKDGIAAIGWDELGDLSQYKDREELTAQGLKFNSSLACWQFSSVMQAGDVVLVRKGKQSLVGAGKVISGYRFDDSRPEFKHVRDMDWRVKTEPAQVRMDRGLPVKTLTDVSDYEYAVKAKEVLNWDWDAPEKPSDPRGLTMLARDLYLPDSKFLEDIIDLLKEKRQVIFQGPPGTGKTFIAMAIAKHVAASDRGVNLVQFHPSYAYEDFVQGYRPCILKSGQSGFKLRDGPLLEAAERARSDPGNCHVLVIDEINRGNLAKVFGELYFLLEYRDRPMRLQYQEHDEDFSFPDNLLIIGTMNTADRSIALVDAALRRRFYFVEFHPDAEPVRGVLGRWLESNAPDVGWLAGVVEGANELLSEDRHAAIGPSYFMNPDLDESGVERIWKHSVLPYIEERLFGEHGRLQEFELAELRRTKNPQESRDDGTPESESD